MEAVGPRWTYSGENHSRRLSGRDRPGARLARMVVTCWSKPCWLWCDVPQKPIGTPHRRQWEPCPAASCSGAQFRSQTQRHLYVQEDEMTCSAEVGIRTKGLRNRSYSSSEEKALGMRYFSGPGFISFLVICMRYGADN